jgi:hypothetical protein
MWKKAAVRVLTIAVLLAMGGGAARAQQAADKSSHPNALPNILVIMGDDIGFWNLSTYNQG